MVSQDPNESFENLLKAHRPLPPAAPAHELERLMEKTRRRAWWAPPAWGLAAGFAAAMALLVLQPRQPQPQPKPVASVEVENMLVEMAERMANPSGDEYVVELPWPTLAGL